MQPIRTTLEAEPEMIQQLLLAAYERFGDAQAALEIGSPTGSVYLAGYCVEMVLKHGALRAEGLPPFAYVRDALAPARGRLEAWLGGVPHDSYHSLEFWALLLRETFGRRRGSVPRTIATAVGRATRMHACWLVSMRYRSGKIAARDAHDFIREAGWFRARAEDLWR